MDNLDISDKMYDRKYQDMQDRLNGLYDEIERLESLIDDIVSRKSISVSRKFLRMECINIFCTLTNCMINSPIWRKKNL